MFTNELHECLLSKNPISFWKTWQSKFGGKKSAKVIEGLTNCDQISEKFADVFETTSKLND